MHNPIQTRPAVDGGFAATWLTIEDDPRVWHNEFSPEYRALPEPFAAAFTALVEDHDDRCGFGQCYGPVGFSDTRWEDTTLVLTREGKVERLCATHGDAMFGNLDRSAA